jgi:hypothetical protein
MNFISFLLGLMRFEQFDDGGSERAAPGDVCVNDTLCVVNGPTCDGTVACGQ